MKTSSFNHLWNAFPIRLDSLQKSKRLSLPSGNDFFISLRFAYLPGDTPEESNTISKSLKQLKDTLADMESNVMQFDYEFDENSHDRYVRTNTNWDITLGRGLHIYQDMKPEKGKRNYFQMGTYDLSLRPCMKTRIIYTKRNAEE